MAAYYNEIDKFAAAWLRELIKARLVADGEVDERSIVDVRPDDLRGFDQCHFFAGIGGWSRALRLAGWPDARRVWTGSCPCQPFSTAGKGGGFADERHLWPAWFWLIAQCRPDCLLGEQVEGTAGRAWLDLVCTDLEAVGYRIGPSNLPAASVGAPNIRQRLFWVADSPESRLEGFTGDVRDGHEPGRLDAHASRPVAACGESSGLENSHCERREELGLQLQPRESREAVPEAAWRGEVGRMADAEYSEWGTVCLDREDGRDWSDGRRQETHSESGTCGEVRSFWSDLEWLPCADGKWRPINGATEPYFLSLADGLWYHLASVLSAAHKTAAQAVRDYATTANISAVEALSLVRRTYESEAVSEWSIGVQFQLPKAEVLLSYLRVVASTLDRTAVYCCGPQAGYKDAPDVMRSVRDRSIARGASFGRESKEQQRGEPSDPLRELSRFLARSARAVAEDITAANAASFPLAQGFPGRVGMLRGAGNAINPEVAAEFIEAYCDARLGG